VSILQTSTFRERAMSHGAGLGEFEQLVLLAILNLGSDARAVEIRLRIESAAKRPVTRGALYAALDRLGAKGFLAYELEDGPPDRGGIPRRLFTVTPRGLAAVRRALAAIRILSRGLDRVLGHAT
jgi:DNA-binding PadR family transcriptional regulator